MRELVIAEAVRIESCGRPPSIESKGTTGSVGHSKSAVWKLEIYQSVYIVKFTMFAYLEEPLSGQKFQPKALRGSPEDLALNH